MQLVDKGTKYAAERRVDVSYKFNKKKLLRKKKSQNEQRENRHRASLKIKRKVVTIVPLTIYLDFHCYTLSTIQKINNISNTRE